MSNEIKARDRVLKSVREALIKPSHENLKDPGFEESLYKELQADDLALQFAETFIQHGGQFIYCENKKDLALQIEQLLGTNANTFIIPSELTQGLDKFKSVDSSAYLENAVLITPCECLCAITGSVLVSSALHPVRKDFFAIDR